MKKLLLIILLSPLALLGQESDYSLDCDYKIEKINDSTYKIQVTNFDSLHSGETCFLGWMNTGKNKPNGILLVFDENSIKRRKAIYQNDIRVGTHLMWYSTGELEDETTWETDLYFTSKGYYKSGKIKNTAENGNHENAVYKSFYENGQLESNWSDTGDKTWYKNGNPKSERNTKNNTYKEWHSNGQLKITGELQFGWTRIGVWKYYNETGKLIRELTYKVGNASWYGDETGHTTEKKY